MVIFKDIVKRIKNLKNPEMYFAIVLAIVVLLIVFVDYSPQKKSSATFEDNTYIAQMEHKISSVVENIEGVNNVTVVISCQAEGVKQYAYDTKTTTSGNVENKTTTLVSVNGKPLVVNSFPPKILGVVVVADGASNPIVKYKIIQIVVTLLDVSQNNVKVFT